MTVIVGFQTLWFIYGFFKYSTSKPKAKAKEK